MFNLSEIGCWRKRFGLYPTSIKPNIGDKYALLNGGHGDFCIDLMPGEDISIYNSFAWSANTKNYLTVNDSDVVIYNWVKNEPERLKRDIVQNNIESFYKYIRTQTYHTGNDVVPFVLNIFRKMRNLTREGSAPIDALSLLHVLLMSLEVDINNLDYDKWAISRVAIPDKFNVFIEEMKSGIGSAKPDLEIILRHCAGPIFQEAHRIVETFYSDRDLFGNVDDRNIGVMQPHTSSHYTPKYVSRSIVEQCLKRANLKKECIKVFDPACGSGEFLLETLRQLYQKNYEGKVSIVGWDCSESAICTSSFLLNYEKEKFWQERLSVVVHKVQDSLEEDWSSDNDIILMNPPFVAWELLDKHQREVVVSHLPYNMPKPNIAAAFLRKAICALTSDGILGCVTPSSVFDSEKYKHLRAYMKETMSSCLVAKLGGFVFDDAFVDVSVYIGKKTFEGDVPILLWCRNEYGVAQDALCALRKMETNNKIDDNSHSYSIYIPEEFPDKQDSWKILSSNDILLKKQLNNKLRSGGHLVELQCTFKIEQGIRTGCNELFIIDKNEYGYMDERERSLYRKSIDSKAINSSKIEVTHYVWYPYNKKGIIITSEDQLRSDAPMTYKRLFPNKNKLEKRKSLINKERWWDLSRHRKNFLEKIPRIISTEFGNSRSFSIDAEGEYMVERGYMWRLKSKAELSDYHFYLSIFTSTLFDKMLSIYSRQLAGGDWYDLGAKFMKHIPIPDVSIYKKTEYYEKLASFGRDIALNGSDLYMDRMNKLVCLLYKVKCDF